jgi:arabinosyltransferase B
MNLDTHQAHTQPTHRDPARNVRVTRWVATIAGLIGFVLSVATPLLPVVQTTATLT